MARAKLSLEATQPDPNLRFMIGHLNVLEPLMLELSDAEVEHQKYFHRYASGPTKPVEFHNLQLDTVTEELPGEDSFTNADQFNAPQRASNNKTDHVTTKAGIEESSEARARCCVTPVKVSKHQTVPSFFRRHQASAVHGNQEVCFLPSRADRDTPRVADESQVETTVAAASPATTSSNSTPFPPTATSSLPSSILGLTSASAPPASSPTTLASSPVPKKPAPRPRSAPRRCLYVRSMLEKVSALAVYGRPSAKSDILFPEDYPHNPGRTSCAACDQSKAMHRPERQRSKIHHGLIASGDSVLKSAALRREAMHSLSDVLCFEMEAAGLMGEFPCVVIRGIADYADSHKNDEWHHFTAAAAAACTKELLSYLDPEDIPAACTDSVGAAGTDDGRPPAGHVFNGTGIQHSGAGGFSVGRGLHIG
ncbi:hypothetical protein HYQ46_001313 [Verticillium longisporum]|nr:hypothetical protein HYQ46_001313 [Verticillium longisporum]